MTTSSFVVVLAILVDTSSCWGHPDASFTRGLGDNLEYFLRDSSGGIQEFVDRNEDAASEVTNNAREIFNELHNVDFIDNEMIADDISAQCIQDNEEIASGVRNREEWALRMKDSNFKPKFGMFAGNTHWMGQYDECITATHQYDQGVSVGIATTHRLMDMAKTTTFNGQYCLLEASILTKDAQISNLGMLDPADDALGDVYNVSLGVCFPSSCSVYDIGNITLKRLQTSPHITLNGVSCNHHNSKYSPMAKLSLFVMSMIIIVFSLATLYDVVLRTLEKSDNIPEINDLGENVASVNAEKRTKMRRNSRISRVILAFSICEHLPKLIDTDGSPATLRCLHGIRLFSLSWVILGHMFAHSQDVIYNAQSMNHIRKSFLFQTVMNETVSVDSFFALSGLLVVYLTMSELKRNKGRLNWFLYIFHRFYRLTPTMGLVMLLFIPTYPYWYHGPMWQEDIPEKCRKYWWHVLLYINTITSGGDCMDVTWYLSNDTMFFFTTPLMIIPAFFWPKIGYLIWFAFLLATSITAGVISRINEFSAAHLGINPIHSEAVWDDVFYEKPWCRMGPYLIGMATGYIIFKTGLKVRMPRWLVLIGWASAATTSMAIVYGPLRVQQGKETLPGVNAFYNSISRTAWGAVVSWVIYACVTGHGGYVNTVLSWGGFFPLSRVSFLAYLTHVCYMMLMHDSLRGFVYASLLDSIYAFIGGLLCTYVMSFILTLAFESPMYALEKAILKRERRG